MTLKSMDILYQNFIWPMKWRILGAGLPWSKEWLISIYYWNWNHIGFITTTYTSSPRFGFGSVPRRNSPCKTFEYIFNPYSARKWHGESLSKREFCTCIHRYLSYAAYWYHTERMAQKLDRAWRITWSGFRCRELSVVLHTSQLKNISGKDYRWFSRWFSNVSFRGVRHQLQATYTGTR